MRTPLVAVPSSVFVAAATLVGVAGVTAPGAVRPLSAQTAAAPPAAAAPGDTVRLAFGWPAGTKAQVSASRYRERVNGASADTSVAHATYELALEAAGDGYLVRYGGFRAAGPAAPDPGVEAVASRLATLVPSYRVSRAGEFQALNDPGALRAAIDSMLAPVRAELRTQNPEIDRLLASMLSDEMLAASAAEDWNVLVGAWVGAEFEVGSAYGAEVTEHLPLFGGIELPMTYELGAVRRLPCDSSDAGAGCVELQMITRPAPDAVREVVDRLFAAMQSPEATEAARSAEFDVENTVVLVARPETLLPYHLVVTKEVKLAMTIGGKRDDAYQLDIREQRFRYARP